MIVEPQSLRKRSGWTRYWRMTTRKPRRQLSATAPRTSHDIPEKGATRPPFSRTSTTPEETNSWRLAYSSAANSTARL
jgi:hypothetical protein